MRGRKGKRVTDVQHYNCDGSGRSREGVVNEGDTGS